VIEGCKALGVKVLGKN